MMNEALKTRIKEMIDSSPVFLFMKGDAQFPMCGFSRQVVYILKELKIPFKVCNVLEDHALREGVKSYSTWPTIPQLYFKGEFIGGCDIVTELYESGELKEKLSCS